MEIDIETDYEHFKEKVEDKLKDIEEKINLMETHLQRLEEKTNAERNMR